MCKGGGTYSIELIAEYMGSRFGAPFLEMPKLKKMMDNQGEWQ